MISVCVTTYNGATYVEEQLRSILAQLSERDEVIVCDDHSADETVEKIRALGDHRISIHVNCYNIGYVRNFEKAIALTRGAYVFLSDQDDVWPPGRVRKMIDALDETGKSLVVGNIEMFDEDVDKRRPFHINVNSKYNRTGWLNMPKLLAGRIPYYGCCMGFRDEAKQYLLPFPSYGVSHDVWIAIVGNWLNQVHHLNDTVIYRRMHGLNVTSSSRSLVSKIKTRFQWLGILGMAIARRSERV